MDQQELRQLIAQAAAEKWTELDLSDQKITALPSEIGQLLSLTKLDLSVNYLTSIPAEIGQLTNLAQLNLRDNQLVAIPPQIGQLTNLTWLSLRMNELTAIPPEIRRLTNLMKLELNTNQLTAIPPEIGQLSNLTDLSLYSNELTTVPPEIVQLINLTAISLGSYHLTTVPPEIWSLTNLTSLYLFGSSLEAIPSEIGQLTNLTELNLSNNRLATVPPEIGQLAKLNYLDLLNNRLLILPPEIMFLTNLTTLTLQANDLTTIPPEIGKLANLRSLDLRHNELERLPESLQLLTQLEYLDLRNNPLLRLSQVILAETSNPALVLKTYFGKSRPLNEAKLLLVGQGGVGKTALARRLLHNLPPENPQDKTPGVDIHKWVFPLATAEPITFNLWDFGGQDVYQATHQFFFTTRSLYLVVINARTGEQESRLRHWLKLVTSLSDNAPVIIVVNKQDEQALTLDERELKYKYPNLLHVIPTSCTTGMGIAELRQAIAELLTHLPGINDTFPTAWFDLKKQLETMDANYITYERYAEYCREAGIETGSDQRSWVQVLHQLGVVLNYQDDKYRHLEGIHVLKPEWVTDGVYRILSDPDGRIAGNNGILTSAMLDHILDPDVYPPNQQFFIIEMMRKFELSFRIPHQPDQYLIPDLLPKEQPSKVTSFEETPTLQFQIHYTDFLPDSILSRFMVGMMSSLDRQASWRNGAILNFDGNNALVRADLDARKLFITISGNETTRRGLLNSIRMQLHAIHNTFPNLPLTEHIPIPGHPDKTIAYHALCNLEAKGIDHHYDPFNDVELDVKALLAGIETPALRRERQLQEALLEAYNLEELMQLCFELDGVDYENLPGETKSAKTRELVQFMGRRNQLDVLEAKLRERPGYSRH